MRAFELLGTKDETEGGALATHLSKINDERKNIVLHIMKDVKSILKREDLKDLPGISYRESGLEGRSTRYRCRGKVVRRI